MSGGPAGGTTLARIANTAVAVGLLVGAVVAVVAEYVLVGVGLVVLSLVSIPGILHPRYNLLWQAIDLALRWPRKGGPQSSLSVVSSSTLPGTTRWTPVPPKSDFA
jgi:hypothetical protein